MVDTHDDSHTYKIAFNVIKEVCQPRIDSGKTYTWITVQDIISYISYRCEEIKYDNRSNKKISYKEIEELRKKHHSWNIKPSDLSKICSERNIDYSYLNTLLRENWQTSI